jgi:PAS domain S-box-containing protein
MKKWEVGMFKELVENSGDIIIVTDSEYRIRYISSSVSSLFSREPVTLIGRSIFEFINSDQKERWKEAMKDQTHFHGEEAIQMILQKRKIVKSSSSSRTSNLIR